MNPSQRNYFENMAPNATLTPSDVKDWSTLISAGKTYIDQGGQLTFSDDYSSVTKPSLIPQDDHIRIYLDGTLLNDFS